MGAGTLIALAGIIATAVVGIAGAVSGWLIARGDRASQEKVAHDARVYNRRADAYLAAVAALRNLDLALYEFTFDPGAETVRQMRATLIRRWSPIGGTALSTGVFVFGSQRAYRDFNAVRRAASRLLNVEQLDNVETTADYREYSKAEDCFFKDVQTELS